ncbi:MAG TPA: SH3 domain-containing protein [Anaerolineales bacterium]|nr:SH3 domain-containing protein [Anaerolineales bacterium]
MHTQVAASVFGTQTAQAPTPTTLLPTATNTPTQAPTATPILPDAVVIGVLLTIYEGPSAAYTTVGSVASADALVVIGQVDNCLWLQVQTAAGQTGWVSGQASKVQLNRSCADIPMGTYRPLNGSVVYDRRAALGSGQFTVQNNADDDALVILSDETDQPVVGVYVRGASEYTLEGIANGTYTVYVATGDDWNGEQRMFDLVWEYWRFEDPALFEAQSDYYTVITITLYAVSQEASSETTAISPDEFPSLAP